MYILCLECSLARSLLRPLRLPRPLGADIVSNSAIFDCWKSKKYIVNMGPLINNKSYQGRFILQCNEKKESLINNKTEKKRSSIIIFGKQRNDLVIKKICYCFSLTQTSYHAWRLILLVFWLRPRRPVMDQPGSKWCPPRTWRLFCKFLLLNSRVYLLDQLLSYHTYF